MMSEHDHPENEPVDPIYEAMARSLNELVNRDLAPLVERIEELERQVAELQDEQRKSKTAGSKPTNRRHR